MADVLTRNQTFASPTEALEHYGKKGMRWGVRNEKKSSGDAPSSREVRKQEKRDDKTALLTAQTAKTNVRINELKKEVAAVPKGGLRNHIRRNELNQELVQTVGYRDHLVKTSKAIEEGRMTPRQKQLIIGGAVVGGLALAVYGSSKVQSGEFAAMKLRGKAALRGEKFDFDKNVSLSGKKTPEEVLSSVVPGINPGYRTQGGSMNCRRCSFTYELRRRGYNVDATTSPMGWGQSESGLLNALSPGRRNLNRATSMSANVVSGRGIRALAWGDRRSSIGERYSHSDANDRAGLFNLLNKQPDGARGEAVFNFGAFGHSLSYEKFGDKIHIFDTQKGQGYDVGLDASYREFINKWGGASAVKDVQITRLDNANLDHKFLARWSTNRPSNSPIPVRRPDPNTTTVSSPKRSTSPGFGNLSVAQILAGSSSTRPEGMHVTEWNRLRRKVGTL
jgi:hypothetical protein